MIQVLVDHSLDVRCEEQHAAAVGKPCDSVQEFCDVDRGDEEVVVGMTVEADACGGKANLSMQRGDRSDERRVLDDGDGVEAKCRVAKVAGGSTPGCQVNDSAKRLS